MKKFTQGNWEITKTVYGCETEVTCDGIRICEVKHYDRFKTDPNYEEGFANAKLIAAAPELLKACMLAMNDCVDLIGTDAGIAIEKAIEKATI